MGYNYNNNQGYAPPSPYGQQPYGQQGGNYGAPPQGYYQQQQPQVVYVQKPNQHSSGGGAGLGAGLCCGLLAGCCCEENTMDSQTLFSVKDKVVVVTGGGSGIGLMISQGFVKNGSRVYIVARKQNVLEKAAQELTAQGTGKCIPLVCDLQDAAQIKQLTEKLAELEPRGIDVLVNNSGANWGSESLESYPDKAWAKVLTLNTQRVFTLTQLLLPQLEKRASKESPARVINIGSIDGVRVPNLITPAYSASKAAVHHLSKVLAAHLGPRNITVNAVAPGPFESHMMKATLDAQYEAIVSSVPLGRIGQPGDMAGICIFLASAAGSYINGTVIPVDGGIVIANGSYSHANL
ncbi:hypothetical protein LPJ77_003415 [Coemansia sp. RSA 2523]|nr:hypothetical protein LPJ58_003616 [Coemansia sp. RSA 1591]KAJ1806769.1 hypothetical protein LPJ77_003415 [Coemansia sp. RSA 2523]KAJ2272221.1 hypothetical protein EV176_003732 [Coemansia sp. RSA 451]